MPFIYSTLTCGNIYTFYEEPSNDGKKLPAVIREIFIAGGANVAPKRRHSVEGHTPAAVMTEVTDEELQLLLTNEMFLLHKKNGFITHENRKKEVDKVAKDLEKRDKSAPKTPEDFTKNPNGPQPMDAKQKQKIADNL